MTCEITRRLTGWYELHRRPLPWRRTADPYAVWLSEVILQQTRVAQGTDYFHRFMERFPTVEALAAAQQDEVLKLWQGLGYYSRARNLHAAAQQIAERFGGRFPADYGALRSLPGVGDYTAAAVASIAFGLPHAVVDGNVYRVLARLFDIRLPIDSGEGRRCFAGLAQSLLDPARPGLSNQALMEFGALQCVPSKPGCGTCPLEEFCLARQRGSVDSLPVKRAKATVRERWFHYLVVDSGGRLLLARRPEGDIWQGLYEFPLVEGERRLAYEELAAQERFCRLFEGAGRITLRSARPLAPHRLSHQLIRATFYRIETERFSPAMLAQYTTVPAAAVGDYAVSRLIDRYLEEEGVAGDF